MGNQVRKLGQAILVLKYGLIGKVNLFARRYIVPGPEIVQESWN